MIDKDSESSYKDDVEKIRKMSYNQYRSDKLAFEHGSAPTGTQKIFFNAREELFEVWEKGDDAILLMARTKLKSEAGVLYERIYRETTDKIRRNLEELESSKGKGDWNNGVSKDGRNDVSNGGSAETKGIQGNARRSGSDLPESDSGKSINNESSPNGGDFSNAKFSAKDNIEETKDLIAVHNSTPEKLMAAFELG